MPDEIAGGRDVTITVVGKPPESNPAALEAWEAQVGRFEAKYPNVTIEGSDYAYDPASFAALVAGGEVPTLFQVYLTDPGKMIDQGVAADITDIITAQGIDKVYNPQVLDIASDGDHYYGIPLAAYAMGLGYNIDLLNAAGYDAAPTTWEEAEEMAKALTDRDNGVAGLSFITDGSNATGWHATVLAYTFGLKQTDIVSGDSSGYTAGFDNQAMLDTLQFIHDVRWTDDVLPLENLAWDTNGQGLATGHSAMVVMAGSQFEWIRGTFADVDMNQFGFAPLPAGPNGQSASLIGGDVRMVSAAASEDEIEAATYYDLWLQFDSAEILAKYESSKSDPTVVIGAPGLPLYVGDYGAATQALINAYANLPVENYSSWVDAVTAGDVLLIPEPLVAGQDYYAAMGTLVSQIVADEGVDIEALLTETLDTYQSNVLDQLQ
jgi:ABC-type glycerol-3-phosphate transport system substrate-binding protein